MPSNTKIPARLDQVLIAPYSANTNMGDEQLTEAAVDVAYRLGFDRIAVLHEPTSKPYMPQRRQVEPRNGFMKHPFSEPRTTGTDRLGAVRFVLEILALAIAWLAGPRSAQLPAFGMKRRRAISDIRASTCVIFKGGGYCHAYGPARDIAALIYLVHVAILARRLKVPYIFLPNSMGPFKGFLAKQIMRYVLSGALAIYLRESTSREYLHAHFPNLQACVVADMAYAIRPNPTERVERVMRDAGLTQAHALLGITARPIRPSEVSDAEWSEERYLESLKGVIRWGVSEGLQPVLITHVAGPRRSEDDRQVLRKLCNVDGRTVPWINSPDLSAEELAAVYGRLTILVATRFHSAIFASASGVPSVVVAYGGFKGRGTMKDMSLDEFCVDADAVTPADLVARTERLISQRAYAARTLAEWVRTTQDKHCAMRAEVAALLERKLRDA
ncbi:polysaccharide pyruvyl transferase family protein [Egicoccus sp. AB-alg2]|uniref:polysaccharide pyruvyl transferase family protein n=1 Tax=Egicoccus sp. AB-alg2 TaxID=3242693 RepID=UPI00359DD1E2